MNHYNMARPGGLWSAIVLLLWVANYGSRSVLAAVGDVEKYSYFCLESQQELCLGISPGETEPSWNPTSIFYLQVKSRLRSEYTNTDYKKTRWDADYATNTITLSKFPELCMAKEAGNGRVGLFPCDQTQIWDNFDPTVRYGKWDLGLFSSNLNSAGTLELIGARGSQCLTVMDCRSMGNDWCDPESQEPAWDVVKNIPKGLRRGSYVRFRECSDSVGGNPLWQNVQVWRQRLDCAPGCSPFEQFNNKCDQVCNREECDWDNEQCRTKSPTPPTHRPTVPGTKTPTLQPTSQTPSQAPTSESPTTSPSKGPTVQPSRNPTVQPSWAPSRTPTISPTIACPAPGVLEMCASLNQAKCNKDKVAKKNCIWCLDKCSPRADPRACIIPTFYNHCKAVCPTDVQRLTCPRFKTAKACSNNKWKRANCVWCPISGMCSPGKDQRQCSNPTHFDHCGTIAPTGAPCPAKFLVDFCLAAQTQQQCTPKRCTWCEGVPNNPCRPSFTQEVCKVSGWTTRTELISLFFPHCGLLHPTSRPSKAPTRVTMQPSKAPRVSTPTKSPVTSRPSKAPIFRPTVSPSMPPMEPTPKPTIGRPSKAPAISKPTQSPVTSLPSRAPIPAPSIAPTASRPTQSPTLRPTTGEPTVAPSRSPTVSSPTRSPTLTPTKRPVPTKRPSQAPTLKPTTGTPSSAPTRGPSSSPSTGVPSSVPSATPSTSKPSAHPSRTPTVSHPSQSPSSVPTTSRPSSAPSKAPTSSSPTNNPTNSRPTSAPSSAPSSSSPTTSPVTVKPSFTPTNSPVTSKPSFVPSRTPTTSSPTSSPTTSVPSFMPSFAPSSRPTGSPSTEAQSDYGMEYGVSD